MFAPNKTNKTNLVPKNTDITKGVPTKKPDVPKANPTKKNLTQKLKSKSKSKSKTRSHRTKTTEFLKLVCPKASECIAFGKETARIQSFFNHYTDFKYVENKTASAKRIGAPSKNGFIHQIEYKHNEYIAYTILKSINIKQRGSFSGSNNPDNLIYEYLVGRFINKMALRFSCFVETYGLFFYNNDDAWDTIKHSTTVSADTLRASLTLYPVGDKIKYELIQKSCTDYKHAAILLQEIHNPLSMNKAVKKEEFLRSEILQTMYQIYFPLACICNYFTHYDLHSDNVLLYPLGADKYITFHYTFHSKIDGSTRTLEFNSQYISKIIDYGRSFFVDKGTTKDKDVNSVIVQKTLCTIPECGENSYKCGIKKGYAWLNPSTQTYSSDYFITSNKSNISHDLRLLHDVRYTIEPSRRSSTKKYAYELGTFMDDLDNIEYGVGIKSASKKAYGTKENRELGFGEDGIPYTINNVVDAEHWLYTLLQTESVRESQTAFYSTKTKMGDIYIDSKLPARFEM